MADDFDDLLNEVENKYCSPSLPSPRTREKDTNDIDKAIRELLTDEEDSHHTGSVTPLRPPLRQSKSPRCETTKCHPVLLDGSGCLMGLNNDSSNKRSCDRLRCVSCDFNVEWFEDKKWKETVQYLFFRNNFPDRSKLITSCTPSKGSRAYCCQCSWRSVTHTVNLSHDTSLKWTCRKH